MFHLYHYSKEAAKKRIEKEQEVTKKSVNLKKNSKYQNENELIKVSQAPSFVQKSYGDRFIARRYNINDSDPEFIRQINSSNQSDNDILHIMKNFQGFWRLYAIRKCFEKNFRNSRASVLIFHDYVTKEMCNSSLMPSGNIDKFDWPCLPRRKVIAATEVSHILKDYCFYSNLNIITWSSLGWMAASFGEDLVLWIPKGKSLLTYEMEGITCLAYNCEGKFLAVGIKLKQEITEKAKRSKKLTEIQIWDVSSDSVGIFITSYEYDGDVADEVRCIAWDPQNKYIVCGMFRGNIYIHKCCSSMRIVETINRSKRCVDGLQLSANQLYLAASYDGGDVCVWNFETFEIVFHWEEKKTESSEEEKKKSLIAWHPWKESYLIISARIPANISLFDVRSKTILGYYKRTDKLCRIDALTFNPKSAELVVSVTLYDADTVTHEILVLAALDRVVDLLNTHEGCVKCLLWNSDGSMLATAGDDNMLNIWNFLGYSEAEKSNSKQKYVSSKLILGNPSMLR